MNEKALKQVLLLYGLIISIIGIAYLKKQPRFEFSEEEYQVVALKKCCKTCKKGKACGDSCINKQLKCHKPKGCACDAE